MRFNPKADEKAAARTLFDDGIYDFEVASAEDAVSKKSGAEMLKLVLWVFDTDGNKTTVFEYLVSSEKAQFKLKEFCRAVGLEEAFDAGELDPLDVQGRTGRCKLTTEIDMSGKWGDKNKVASYLPRPADLPLVPTASVARAAPKLRAARDAGNGSLEDDEIPF